MGEKKTVWITGASSGIGEAMALEFAREKHTLILSARKESSLEGIKNTCENLGSKVITTSLDLTLSETIDSSVELVLKQVSTIDVLVNNGGISQRSWIIDTPMDIDRKIMEVDYFGHVYLTKKLLPFMVNQKSGHIIVISSLSGLFGFHMRSAYCAAKHALHGFFETLILEHFKDNIHVTMVCPGRIFTNISYHSLKADGTEHNKLDDAQKNGMPVDVAARKIMKAYRRKKKEVIVAQKEGILVFFKKFMPFVFYKILRNVNPN